MSIHVLIPTWTPKRAAGKARNLIKMGQSVTCQIVRGLGCLQAMALVKPGSADLLMFVHDDVDILEAGWDARIEEAAKNKNVGLLGFGGAMAFGREDIYKTSYELMQLIRYDFRSNMRDWHVHGSRTTQSQRVTFLDGFCLIFTHECYDKIGGWQRAINDGLPPFHSYDMWAAIRVAEIGLEAWLVPVRCHHAGGLTSNTRRYNRFIRRCGYTSDLDAFEKGHRLCYEVGRGVLPMGFDYERPQT